MTNTNSIKVGTILRVTTDSESLGLDRGTSARVIRVRGGTMNLYVASLDMTIAGVAVDHADLAVRV